MVLGTLLHPLHGLCVGDAMNVKRSQSAGVPEGSSKHIEEFGQHSSHVRLLLLLLCSLNGGT